MVDTTVLNLGAGGDTIATDDIGGVKHQQVLLEFGPNNTATRVASAAPLPVDDPFLDVAKGNRHAFEHVVGRNVDVDIAAAEDLWDAGGIWVPPTTARLHDVVSTAVADDGAPAGTGAQTVQVFGLDASFDEQNETLTLNGITNVPTVNSYTMIHRLVILTAGSGGVNAGTITATAQTDATVTAQIAIGNNRSLMAIYQVPNAKTAHLVQLRASMLSSVITGAADVSLLIQPDTEPIQMHDLVGLVGPGTSAVERRYLVPIALAAKTIVRLRGFVSVDNTDISGGFDLVVV